MAGETNLNTLLASMNPVLLQDTYVFCTFPEARYGDYKEAAPIATFQESEGLTVVVTKTAADQLAFEYESTFKCISLKIHSSLEAVGLTAAIANRLSEQNISANVIAAYFHDHVFVPQEHAEKALKLLQTISE